MRLLTLAAAVAVAWTISGQAQAHFIWVDVVPTEEGQSAQVYFSETPEPGGAELVGKIGKTKVWTRTIDTAATPLEMSAQVNDDTGALAAPLAQAAPYSVAADFEYGVFRRGETALRLHYYAKHLAHRHVADLSSLGRDQGLALDVVPHVDGDQLRLTVLWQGKPAAGAEVILLDADGEEQKHAADDKGQVRVAVSSGKQAIRARVVDAKDQGELNGQAYSQAWHICTLTFALDAGRDAAGAPADASQSVAAGELLERARDARAVWRDFPGFKSHVVIRVDDELAEGELTVDASGDVALSGVSNGVKGWAAQQLQLLVRHRLPAPFAESEVVFGDDGKNPLGRLIKFEGDSAHSAYRVKEDVIREVNRSMGRSRFTISTLEVSRNPEGKYLPHSYSASYWDTSSGKLTANEAVCQTWVRVGKLDLPAEHVVVKSSDGEQKVLQITFSKHELLPATTVSSNLR